MTMTDPAYGPQGQPANPYPAYQAELGDLGTSNNALSQIASQLGGAGALTAGLGANQQQAAQADYEAALANSALSTQYAGQQAGYEQAQLGLKGQEIGIQQLGTTQEQQLEGVEEPIQTSNLVGGLAAQGALNTKGSQQQQQQLGAQQQYTNEQLQNAQQTLGLTAAANGISTQEVMAQLNYAINSAGLSDQVSAIDLLNQIAGIQEGTLSGLETDISPLIFGNQLGFNAFSGSARPVASPQTPVSPSTLTDIGAF
jgi:hypothetical protein